MSQIVTREQIEALAAEYAAGFAAAVAQVVREPAANGHTKNGKVTKLRVTDSRIARCRAYLAKLPGGKEGDYGSRVTFKACRIAWNDFGLSDEEAWELLVEWNEKCDPPRPLEYADGGAQCLRRKLEQAVSKGPCPKGRGWRLKQDRDDDTPTVDEDEPEGDEQTADAEKPPTGGGAVGKAAAPRKLRRGQICPSSGLPEIIHTARQYRDVEADALQALVEANDPPWVFVGNGGVLVDLSQPDPLQPPRARPLDGPAMRPVFSRVADWYKQTYSEKKGWSEPHNDFPPQPLLTSFPVRGSWPGVPLLRGIVPYPVFPPNWELITQTGYHRPSGLYCHLGGLVMPAVPERPADAELAAAKELILTDLFGDFPFADDGGASLAHAVAMLVLPLVRHTIDGPTPLAVADAPTAGTGKSLLVEACLLTTLGEIPEAMTADKKEDERDKELLALLIEGQPVVFFDNANARLDSGSFANTLTARHKRGRILGETRTARAAVNVCWVLSGNNFTCSYEISRRMYWTRIDSGLEAPHTRDPSTFRHPDLLGWVQENRPRLLWALCVLIRHWRATGARPGAKVLGKFERWSRTVGGILEAAGIKGFLGNEEAFRRQNADQVGELRAFVEEWAAKLGTGTPRIVSDLYDIAKEHLGEVMTQPTEEGKRKQLGKYLRTKKDATVGSYRIEIATDADGKEIKDYAKRTKFRLVTAKPRVKDRPPADEQFELSG